MLGMVYDPAGVTDEVLDLRLSMLNQPGYGEFFAAMFAGDKQAMLDSAIITGEEAARVKAQVAIVHGRNDLPCPVEETALRHAAMFPKADVTLIGECGHGPPRETPAKWLAAATSLFG
jgi:2-hydroxymuconate-semialdehyde hydrolase